MTYLIIVIVLFVIILGYFKVANHYNIIDKPNNRSSHSEVTIRGGGIIFPAALLLYWAFFNNVPLLLVVSILLVSVISFIDDIYTLSAKVRVIGQLIAVTALIYAIPGISWPVWCLPIIYILVIGALNAYNFMDGINGITGLYSLVILLSLWYVNKALQFTDQPFIITFSLACIVFLFFNFRKRAKCFAGDVGSVSVGLWIIALLIMLICKTGDIKYVLFMAVYGVDVILTIIHRLYLRQNIFDAHRLHFYQILANECKMSHLLISAIYGTIQLCINLMVIFLNISAFATATIIIASLTIMYVALKRRLMAASNMTA